MGKNTRDTTPPAPNTMDFPMKALLPANCGSLTDDQMAEKMSEGAVWQIASRSLISTTIDDKGLEIFSRHGEKTGALAACVSRGSFLQKLDFAKIRTINSYKTGDRHVLVITFKESANLGNVTGLDAPTRSLMLEAKNVAAATGITEEFHNFQLRTFKDIPPTKGRGSRRPSVVAPGASVPVVSANIGLVNSALVPA